MSIDPKVKSVIRLIENKEIEKEDYNSLLTAILKHNVSQESFPKKTIYITIIARRILWL